MAESDQKKTDEPAQRPGMTRRSFVTTAAAAGAGVVIVPRHVLGRGLQAPSDTVNLAIVGIGGMTPALAHSSTTVRLPTYATTWVSPVMLWYTNRNWSEVL